MNAKITDVKVVSALDQATITIGRGYTGQRGKVDDLPKDMREALLDWLGVPESLAAAWDEGFSDGMHQWTLQRNDPKHPITRTNPFASKS